MGIRPCLSARRDAAALPLYWSCHRLLSSALSATPRAILYPVRNALEAGNSGSAALCRELCRELYRKRKVKGEEFDKARDKAHDKA
jgi:hypothetical protein